MARDHSVRVAVIGAGSQGIAQCRGLASIPGVEIAGIADLNPDRLQLAGKALQLSPKVCFTDAEEMLRGAAPLDLVSIATTAPTHVLLGSLALGAGARCILLEKPMDVSLAAARAFTRQCESAGVRLAINYSRRWLVDHRAVRRALAAGLIGTPRSLAITIGKGELAMHASHYFDLSRFLLDSEPAWVQAHLEPIAEENIRGAQYTDPSGHCTIGFQNGARAFIDFSSDLVNKDPFITVKGTQGQITIDEQRLFWTMQSRSQRTWTFPFAEDLRSATTFPRVAAELLSGERPACTGHDGAVALEMILGAHLSDRHQSQVVRFPLSDEDADLGIVFP
ncbi:MAG: Gfo/Idh/MocA family protein [Armatimonadota bacterium]